MKKLLILIFISTLSLLQSEEWIYYSKVDPAWNISSYRIDPNTGIFEYLFQDTFVSDVSEDGNNLLLSNFSSGEVLNVSLESGDIDTISTGVLGKYCLNDSTIIFLSGYNELYKFNIENEVVTLLAENALGSASITPSPDKTMLVYHKGHWSEMGIQEIVTVDISTGLNTTIAANGSASFEGSLIAWGNSGYIYYEGGGNDTIPRQIWKVYFDGTEEPTQITDLNGWCSSPVVSKNTSPDQLLFSFGSNYWDSTSTVYNYKLIDGSITEVLTDSIFIWFKSWSPDNSKFVYNTFTESENSGLDDLRLVVYDFETGLTTTIADSATGGWLWVGDSELNINDFTEFMPSAFTLEQNYPNPFNPSTTISYQIPSFSFVELYVYNMNGILIETLVNQNQQHGTHSILWNTKNLSTGVYFYQLKLNGEILGTKQAVLLK